SCVTLPRRHSRSQVVAVCTAFAVPPHTQTVSSNPRMVLFLIVLPLNCVIDASSGRGFSVRRLCAPRIGSSKNRRGNVRRAAILTSLRFAFPHVLVMTQQAVVR